MSALAGSVPVYAGLPAGTACTVLCTSAGHASVARKQVRQLIHLAGIEPAGKRRTLGRRGRHARVYKAADLIRAYQAVAVLTGAGLPDPPASSQPRGGAGEGAGGVLAGDQAGRPGVI